jgi:hypothetical protein
MQFRRSIVAATGLLLGAALQVAGGEEDTEPKLGRFPRSQFAIERDRFLPATDPKTVAAGDAKHVWGQDEVFGVVLGERARAYPITMLSYHHVVNDRIGSQSIAVTYCVICSSGVAYDPRVDGRRLTFGFEGIWQGVAVLYDHQTKSLWMHLTGECFAGKLKGRVLKRLGTGRQTNWTDWRRHHAATDILAPDPRYVGRKDDRGYFARYSCRSGSTYFPDYFLRTIQHRDSRLRRHDLVYGVVAGGRARAYPFLDLMFTKGVVDETFGGVEATVWYDRRTRSAAAFDRKQGEKLLTFSVRPDGLREDLQTKSRWNTEGICVDGPSKGARLVPLRGVMAEWYGWAAHHPATEIWKPKAPDQPGKR